MSIFADYARVYDLLYKNKEYDTEADWVSRQIRAFQPDARTLLELGCGSGGHAFCFAGKGFRVTGVDQSSEMIRAACDKFPVANLPPDRLPVFKEGDLRSVRLSEKFDSVISLFHVMSYQTANEDLNAAFQTAREHLTSGGLFLFDCWYGPGVLCDLPTVRIKRLEDEKVKVVRLSEPRMRPEKNMVEVDFDLLVTEKKTEKAYSIREKHEMRYLFQPEIEYFMKNNGFTFLKNLEWMREKDAETPWYSCFIGKKNG